MKLLETLRKFWEKIKPAPKSAPVSPEFSYRIFWAKQALSWTSEERERIRREVNEVIDREGFEPNEYIRKYSLETSAGRAHAGASMMVLHEVLTDIERIEDSGGLE